MAKILLLPGAFPSVLYPGVELARRLASAGHEVTLAGLPAVASSARALAEHHGLGFLELKGSQLGEFLVADAEKSFIRRLLTFRRRRQEARELLGVEEFRRVLEALSPDLLLADVELHEHILTAVGAGVKVALLNPFASIWRRPGLPPNHCLVRPGVGWRGSRWGMALLWLAARWRKRGRAWRQRWRSVGCDRLSLLRELARDGGFDFRRGTDDSQWLIPFTYRHLPVLSLHAREFEFPHEPPPQVTYVGPMVLEERVDRSLPPEDRARLDEILARHGGTASSSPRRLIYAGFGSVFSTDGDFLRRLLAAVVAEEDWELVLSFSGRATGENPELPPESLGERVHRFGWLPQLEMLEHAAAAVTHGGINTLDECVLAGVPVLVYCGHETDMAGNTARVVHHGIGIAGDRRRDSPQTIRHHLRRLLEEPSFPRRVGELRRSYRAYVQHRQAERAVAELLKAEEATDPGAPPTPGAQP
ncbi:MAG: glycosyltransferase [Acidobacteriota bacterium]|nr:glycosyltransferase [Acidobacteriota bacterium]